MAFIKFMRSILAHDEAITAPSVDTYDLPSNAMSYVMFTFKCLNVTNEATLAEILARVTKIEVLHKSSAVHSYSMADLFAINCFMFGVEPILFNMVADDDGTRAIPLVIPFGLKLDDPEFGLPKSDAGDYQLQITLEDTETACDGVIYQIEVEQIPGAAFKAHTRFYTKARTITATGPDEITLNRGNQLLGIMIYETTKLITTAWTNTIEYVELLINGVEDGWGRSYWESLRGDMMARCGYIGDHSAAFGGDKIAHYALMDLDKTRDQRYALETQNLSELKLRYYGGATDAFRIVPWELKKV